MPYCPFCKSELSIDETAGERCPVCVHSFAGVAFEPVAETTSDSIAAGIADSQSPDALFVPPNDGPHLEPDLAAVRAVLAKIAQRDPDAQSAGALAGALALPSRPSPTLAGAIALPSRPSLASSEASATVDFGQVDMAALMAQARIAPAAAQPLAPPNAGDDLDGLASADAAPSSAPLASSSPVASAPAPSSPIDSSADAPSEVMRTAVIAHGVTVDLPGPVFDPGAFAPPAPPQPPRISPTGTHIDDRRFEQTVEIPQGGVDAFAHGGAPLPDAAPPHAAGADRGAGGERPVATPTGTHYDDRNSSATVDFAAHDVPQVFEQPESGDLRPPTAHSVGPNEATLDSAYMADPAGWSSIVSPGGDPRMSLKAGGVPSHNDSKLVINKRSLFTGKQAPNRQGDYEIQEVLGEGGMGIVYLARQASIDRTVAVKMLKGEIAKSRDQRDKFLSEAVVTGDLDHPNIVPIYDVGANDAGALFYSMKRVIGTPWIKVLRSKSRDENLEILMKVADAIAFAHVRGVVHRDIKPENTMLGEFGEVLVMDWGLALSTPDFRKAASVTQTSSMGGTPAYMAPEMATGPMDIIGPAADIYLLGAVLYEIIAGKPPHAGDTVMNCLVAAARNEIESTEHAGELLDIALRAMATKPAERYATTKEFQHAIREYQSHTNSIAMSTRAEDDLATAQVARDYQLFSRAMFAFQEALEMWDDNKRARAGVSHAKLSYAAAALDKGDLDLGLSLLDPANEDHTPLIRRLSAEQRERGARQQRLKNAKRIMIGLTAAVIVLVTGGLIYVNGERNKALLAEQQAKDDRNIAINARTEALEMKSAAEKSEAKATISADEAKLAAIKAKAEEVKAIKAEREASHDRDVAQQAKASEEYESYVARVGLIAAKIDENAFDKAQALLVECKPNFRDWEWGRLSYLCNQSMRSCDAGAPVDSVAWFPDEKRFATGEWDGTVKIWNADSGELERAIPYGALYVHSVAISPDGRHLAAGGSDKKAYIKIWNADTFELEHELTGHADEVLSISYSRDGKRLLTSSYDKTARLWDVATGRELQVFKGHAWWVWSAQFSPDEKQIVTAGQDGKVIVWQTASGESGPPFAGHAGPVYSAVFSPDGRSVASGGNDKRVLVWETAKVKAFDFEHVSAVGANPPPVYKAFEGHAAAVRCVRFSRDGARLASGSHDNTVRLWELASGKELKTIRGHAGWVRSCALDRLGERILSGSHDNTAKVWNIAGYEEERVLQAQMLEGHADAILSAHFSPDGQSIATASRDRTAKVWDTKSGRELKHFEEGHDYLASTAIFFDDGKRVITSAADNTARIWDVSNGTQALRLDHTGRSAACAISQRGDLALTGSDSKQARLWNTSTGELIRVFPAHQTDVCAVAFSPDDRLIAAGDAAGHCTLYVADTGALVKRLEGHSKRIVAAVFLPDGKRLLTASSDYTVGQWDVASGKEDQAHPLRHPDAVSGLVLLAEGKYCVTLCNDGLARLWRLADAQMIRSFGSQGGSVDSLALSPDSRRVATVSSRDRVVREWDLATGEALPGPGGRPTLLALKSGTIWSVAYAPDGVYLLTVGGNNARMWDLASGRSGISFSPHGAVACANFSPNGRRLVTASWDNSAKLWDVASGRATAKLEGEHTGSVNCAVFSPTGDTVLTASDDHTAKLWNADTAKVLATFVGHENRVRSAAFSADGQRIVTASADKTARIWDVATHETLQELKGHVWGLLSASFSVDGQRVITGGEDNTARIWNAASGQMLLTLQGHTASINWVALSPDGRRALTASQDSTVKLWDASTGDEFPMPSGKELLTLRGHLQEVTAAEFSVDGRSVVTGSRDGTAIVWMSDEWRDGPRLDPGDMRQPVAAAPLRLDRSVGHQRAESNRTLDLRPSGFGHR